MSFCYFCGKEGKVGQELQEEETRSFNGKTSYVLGCKNIPACIEWKMQKDAEWYKTHPQYAKKGGD